MLTIYCILFGLKLFAREGGMKYINLNIFGLTC